ncbi:MAG: protein-L-isoaspartate(D-aspartate) O-methyltransferase [Proteobacteria bacterium]|nr:protein-L-isoaspartate(D-aspartate) O-methyltransferase [Pseudomonadota bacterium]
MTPDSRKIRLILDLRAGGVTDRLVLGAMERVPRELFVPKLFRDKAYDNVALPIGHHQTLSQPLVVGLMTQALEVGPRMKVLEIGTGSGYHAAVAARLCRRLYTIERHPDLLGEAEARFAELGISNITTRAGDGTLGWPEQVPFERILVTAAAADVPAPLVDQLAEGGVMVVPVDDGSDDGRRLIRVRRSSDGVETEDLGPVKFVPLVPERVRGTG